MAYILSQTTNRSFLYPVTADYANSLTILNSPSSVASAHTTSPSTLTNNHNSSITSSSSSSFSLVTPQQPNWSNHIPTYHSPSSAAVAAALTGHNLSMEPNIPTMVVHVPYARLVPSSTHYTTHLRSSVPNTTNTSNTGGDLDRLSASTAFSYRTSSTSTSTSYPTYSYRHQTPSPPIHFIHEEKNESTTLVNKNNNKNNPNSTLNRNRTPSNNEIRKKEKAEILENDKENPYENRQEQQPLMKENEVGIQKSVERPKRKKRTPPKKLLIKPKLATGSEEIENEHDTLSIERSHHGENEKLLLSSSTEISHNENNNTNNSPPLCERDGTDSKSGNGARLSDNRRAKKNTRERQRRQELNHQFDKLCSLLKLERHKMRKTYLLSKANHFIETLVKENQSLRQKLSLPSQSYPLLTLQNNENENNIVSDHSGGSEISDHEEHDEHNEEQNTSSKHKNNNNPNENFNTPRSPHSMRSTSQFDQEITLSDRDHYSNSSPRKKIKQSRTSLPSNDSPPNYEDNSHPVSVPSPHSTSRPSIRQQLLEIAKLKDYVDDKLSHSNNKLNYSTNEQSSSQGNTRRKKYSNRNRGQQDNEFEEREINTNQIAVEKSEFDQLLAACQQISSHENRKPIHKYNENQTEGRLHSRLDDSRSDDEDVDDEIADNLSTSSNNSNSTRKLKKNINRSFRKKSKRLRRSTDWIPS